MWFGKWAHSSPHLIALYLLPTAIVTTATGADAPPTDAVDFESQIEPILIERCIECHSETGSSNGNLELDSRVGALRGGDSGISVLELNPDRNELLRRIMATDVHDRMPRNGPALTDDEIDLFRRWVEQGAYWPTVRQPSEYERKYEEQKSLVVRLRDVYANWIRPYKWAAAGLGLILLIGLEFWKSLIRRQHRWTTGRLRYLSPLIQCLRPSTYVLAGLSLCLLILYYRYTLLESRLDQLVKHSRKQARAEFSDSVVEAFGDPPVPPRPDGVRGISKVYYRGNCERNHELYNNGNYRTATFRIQLCNKAGQPIADGEMKAGEELLLRLEIERAPGTPDALFSPTILDEIFLSQSSKTSVSRSRHHGFEPLRTAEEGQRWVVDYSLGQISEDDQSLQGMVYVHRAMGETGSEPTSSALVYALTYDLIVQNQRLTEESDIWLGSLWPELEISQAEWLSTNPIPEIEGTNTDDPKLLGIYEHIPDYKKKDK